VPVAKTKTSAKNPMRVLRTRLSKVGVNRKFLNGVVLPSWWDDSLALSQGGFREAAGYVCAHLGYGLKSLLDERHELVFAPHSGVKYKKAKGVTEGDVALATHYALRVARAVVAASAELSPVAQVPAPEDWRKALLAISDRPWVCLRHILKATWELGIPVIYLKNLPRGVKKPDALTTMIGNRPVIVVLNGRKSPSWIAFTVAHELGHIHLGHLKAGETLVDEKIDTQAGEKDEVDANDYASKLLTGHSDLGLNTSSKLAPPQLAALSKLFGKKYLIAPGVVAWNYAFTTGQWPVAGAAVGILEKDDNAEAYMKTAMLEHLDLDELSDDSREWISRAASVFE
jgi:IrrE N-terminal-like domain